MTEQRGSMSANQKSCDVCPILHRRIAELEREVERLKLPYAGYSFADLGEAEETITQLERQVQLEHDDCCKLSTAVVKLTAERDSLKAQLAALDWQPITAENMPKVGDEVLDIEEPIALIDMISAYEKFALEHWQKVGYTHFRKLNAPKGSPHVR